MAMYEWLCMYCYVYMAMYVWLFFMAMFVWLCMYGGVYVCIKAPAFTIYKTLLIDE